MLIFRQNSPLNTARKSQPPLASQPHLCPFPLVTAPSTDPDHSASPWSLTLLPLTLTPVPTASPAHPCPTPRSYSSLKSQLTYHFCREAFPDTHFSLRLEHGTYNALLKLLVEMLFCPTVSALTRSIFCWITLLWSLSWAW